MQLTVLGSSGSSPSRTNPASGYLVEAGGQSIWLDAGPGTFMRLGSYMDPGQLSAAVVSHIHVDHSSDIMALYSYLAYGPGGDFPIPVFVPVEARDQLSAYARGTQLEVFHRVLDIQTVEPGDKAQIGDVTLQFAEAQHTVPALITTVEHESRSLVYSGDTGPGSELPVAARDCDLLLCEATYQGERTPELWDGHLTASEVGELASAADVDRLVITHLRATQNRELTAEEAIAAFGRDVPVALPDDVFDI